MTARVGAVRVLSTGLLLVSVMAAAGCASSRPRSDISTITSPRPDVVSSGFPDERVLASLGTIGIVAGDLPREATVSARMTRGAAAWRGAREAAKGTFVGFTVACLQPTEWFLFQLVACPIAGAALAPVGAGVGAVVEAVRADGTASIDAAPAVTLRAVTDAGVPGAVRDRVVQLGTDWPRSRPWRFVALTDDADTVAEGHVLADRGVGSLLEINVESLRLANANPGLYAPLVLAITVHVRLRTVPELRIVHEQSLRWESSARSLGQWLRDDGRRLREAAGQASREIADRILDEVFLLFPPLDRLPALASHTVREKIPFLEDGRTTRDEALERFGAPARRYEGSRIVTYVLWEDTGGKLRVSAESSPKSKRFRLVLVFGPDDRLEQHRLVAVDTP